MAGPTEETGDTNTTLPILKLTTCWIKEIIEKVNMHLDGKMVKMILTAKMAFCNVSLTKIQNRGQNARLSQVPLTILLHSQSGHFQNARVS